MDRDGNEVEADDVILQAIYLGDEDEIILPQFITDIGNDFFCFDDQRKQSEPLKVVHYTNQIRSLQRLFSGLKNVKSIDLQEFNFDGVTDIGRMFEDCQYLESIYFGDDCQLRPRYCQDAFFGCISLKEVDTEHIDMSRCRNVMGMFQNCYCLKHIKLNTIGGQDCRQTQRMFTNCDSLETLEIDYWASPQVVKADQMFQHTKSLKKIDMQNWRHDEQLAAPGMFVYSGVEEIKLGHFGSDGITVCREMFRGCQRLKSIDYENLNIDKSICLESLFDGCRELEELSIKINAKDAHEVDVGLAFQCMQKLKKLTLEINDQNITNLDSAIGMDESLEEFTVRTNKPQEMHKMLNTTWLRNIRKIEFIGITVDSKNIMNEIIDELSTLYNLDKLEQIIVRDTATGELLDSDEIIRKARILEQRGF